MAGRRRAENQRLRTLLATADWTYAGLARAVNALGAENGISLRYDRTSVAHWLAGSLPRRRSRDLIAEAFSRRLHRFVGLGELGMDTSSPEALPTADPPGGQAPGQAPQAVPHLAALCAMDADPARRVLLEESLYRTEVLAVPEGEPQGVVSRPTEVASDGESRARHLHDLRAAVTFFQQADNFGGRHGRSALVAYLKDDVAVGLRADGPGGVRGHVLVEATRLVHLLARMYADDLKHGAAQRYFRAALLLAAESDDRTAYAVVLGGMGGHALELGHSRAALRLAGTAAHGMHACTPPHIRALLTSRLAAARAATGDRKGAITSLDSADRHHERARASGPVNTSGPASQAALHFRKGRTLAVLGDRESAVAVLRRAAEHWPPTAFRPRALTHAAIAPLLLRVGRLDEACSAWHRFLDDYHHLRSGRADRALTELRGSLRAHRATGPVRAVLRRAEGAAGTQHVQQVRPPKRG